MGLPMGRPGDLRAADQNNLDGYFENNLMVERTFGLLAEFAGPDSLLPTLPENWLEMPEFQPHLDKLSAFLPEYWRGQSTFAWKDPRTAVVLPVYQEVFRRLGWQPKYIVMFRNPLDVAASFARRDETPEEFGLGLWLHYNLYALTHLGGADVAVVWYSEFVKDPCGVTESALRALGLPILDSGRETVQKMIRSERSHSWRPEEEVDKAKPELVGATYRALIDAAHTPGIFKDPAFQTRVTDLWKEWQWLGRLCRGNWCQGLLVFGWKTKSGSFKTTNTRFEATQQFFKRTVKINDHAGEHLFFHLADFLPALVHVKNACFIAPDGTRYPATPLAGMHAYVRQMPDSGARALAYEEGDQLVFQIPPVVDSLEFEFEASVEITYRIARAATNVLAADLGRLRQRMGGPFGVRP